MCKNLLYKKEKNREMYTWLISCRVMFELQISKISLVLVTTLAQVIFFLATKKRHESKISADILFLYIYKKHSLKASFKQMWMVPQ